MTRETISSFFVKQKRNYYETIDRIIALFCTQLDLGNLRLRCIIYYFFSLFFPPPPSCIIGFYFYLREWRTYLNILILYVYLYVNE